MTVPQYHYSEVLPIKAFVRSTWLVERKDGKTFLAVWHKDAKIEDVAAYIKIKNPTLKFTVAAFDVGLLEISKVDFSSSNGRKVDQDLNVIV